MKRLPRSLLAPEAPPPPASAAAKHPLWDRWTQASRIAGTDEAAILVPVADLVRHPAVQSRVRIDDAPDGAVDRYAAEMKRLLATGRDPASEFAPVFVFLVDGQLVVSRGFHRTLAAERARVPHLRAVFRQGSLKDAKWDAMSDNAAHGLPRTREDLAKNLRDILTDPDWCHLSNVQIGDHLRVADTTVLRHRRLLDEELAGIAFEKELAGISPALHAGGAATSASPRLEPGAEPHAQEGIDPAAPAAQKAEEATRLGADGKRRRLPRPAPLPDPCNMRDADRGQRPAPRSGSALAQSYGAEAVASALSGRAHTFTASPAAVDKAAKSLRSWGKISGLPAGDLVALLDGYAAELRSADRAQKRKPPAQQEVVYDDEPI